VQERERIIREQQEAIRGARVWRQLTETLENEAKKIAHALHDEAGQLLASVHIAIADIADQLPPRHRERLNEVKWLLGKIETELRNFSHELRPVVLDRLGLVPALQFLAENVGRRAGVAIAVSGELGARLAPAVEITLYRIAQEALNNVIKHARASAANIEVRHIAERVSCTVRDDGVGFAANRLEGGTGLGLVGIRERLGALGGSVHIASQPGGGTTLRAEIPLRR